jgi:drug/metabolite transporter (DMT)-like permease
VPFEIMTAAHHPSLARVLLLLTGVFACSTSVIFIKASETHPVVLAALRLLFAGLLLTPLYWRERSRHATTFTADHRRRTWLPAFVLALHFISWAYGARLVVAAQATLIVNLAPIAMPFFLHALVGERINRREILGTSVALSAVVLLSARDAWAADAEVWGNVVCFGSMLLFAWYLALGRRNRDFPSLWLYVVPVYQRGAVLALLFALPWLPTFQFEAAREWLLMLAMTVFPTLIGHSLLNASMRHLRGQFVTLTNVNQFIFAGLLGWFIYREQPSTIFYGASILAVSGIALVLWNAPSPPPRMR